MRSQVGMCICVCWVYVYNTKGGHIWNIPLTPTSPVGIALHWSDFVRTSSCLWSKCGECGEAREALRLLFTSAHWNSTAGAEEGTLWKYHLHDICTYLNILYTNRCFVENCFAASFPKPLLLGHFSMSPHFVLSHSS